MLYVVSSNNGGTVALEIVPDAGALMRVEAGDDVIHCLFTDDQFKEFRRAVGYIWNDSGWN